VAKRPLILQSHMKSPKLLWVCRWDAGYNNMLVDATKKKKYTVWNRCELTKDSASGICEGCKGPLRYRLVERRADQ